MQDNRAPRWRFDLSSFAIGMLISVPLAVTGTATAFDMGSVGNLGNLIPSSVKSLVNIKRNLDNDVKLLTKDAKVLLGDKDNLLEIKNQLMKLAKETRVQIDSVSKLVGVVEGHLKTTQQNISTTAGHVNEIDTVRKQLSGKK